MRCPLFARPVAQGTTFIGSLNQTIRECYYICISLKAAGFLNRVIYYTLVGYIPVGACNTLSATDVHGQPVSSSTSQQL